MLRQIALAFALILLGLAAFVSLETAFSPTFQNCIAGEKNPYNSNPPEQNPPAFKPRSPTAFVECTGGFTETYGGAISALATIAIAAFTFTLWIATTRQAHLTREALAADKRAFVFAKGLPQLSEPVQVGRATKYNWRFRAILVNSGDTPTKDMRVTIDCELRNNQHPKGHVFPEDRAKAVTGLIPPRSDVTSGIVPLAPVPALTPQDILDLQAGKKHFYIWGTIRYFDVFPQTKEHVTKFCWLLVVVGDPNTYVPNTPGRPPTKGTLTFDYVHHTEGNCADDECGE